MNPYNRNEAETIAWESGIETEKLSNGGVNIYAIGNNDYIKIRSVDFGDNGAGGLRQIFLVKKLVELLNYA